MDPIRANEERKAAMGTEGTMVPNVESRDASTGAKSQSERSARGRSLCGIRTYIDCSNARINVNAITGVISIRRVRWRQVT